MTGVLSLLMALQFFDGLHLAEGPQVSMYVRSLSSIPGYMETTLQGAWRIREYGVYGSFGRTLETGLTQRTGGVSWIWGTHRFGAEVREFHQGPLAHRAWWFRYWAQISPEWALRVSLSPRSRPEAKAALIWCPQEWMLGTQWDRKMFWFAGVHAAPGLWVGVGWDSSPTTFVHWRLGHLGIWARQRQHAFLGSVQEVSWRWTLD